MKGGAWPKLFKSHKTLQRAYWHCSPYKASTGSIDFQYPS